MSRQDGAKPRYDEAALAAAASAVKSQSIDEGRKKYLQILRIIFIVQLALGIALLICGGLGVKFRSGSSDPFGPPYFTGAFIVGILILVAGLISLINYRRAKTIDTANQDEVKDLSCFMCVESALCVGTCFGSFMGIFFVAAFGLRDCGPSLFGCNYTVNMSQNKTTAVFILLFILASVAISLVNIFCMCRYGQQFGVNLRQRRGGPLVIVGGTRGAAYQATSTPVVTETGYNYAPVIIGSTPNTANQPSQYPPPVSVGGATPNTSGFPSQYPAGAPGQTYTTNQTIQELQEQNRLLQEQIRLQQQQLELQQQLQQQAGYVPPTATPTTMPPPPSYEQCTSEEAKISQLEEHNQQLRQHYQQHQHELEKQVPSTGPGLEPSAPSK